MSKQLKGVIFSIRDVLAPERGKNSSLFKEVVRLLQFLISQDIQPVVLAQHEFKYDGIPFEDALTVLVGKFPWFIGQRDGFAAKRKNDGVNRILDRMGWDTTEVVYVGCTKDDMITAVNSKLLFLNALWFRSETDYGIKFDSPKEIARFVDVFCLTEHLWGFEIVDGPLEYYSLGTFSTYYSEFADYSHDARAAAKSGNGHIDFWTKYLWSRIYFSEFYKELDYITSYPGHKANYESTASSAVQEPLEAFSKCFQIEYLKDLIIRHTTSVKSQSARNQGNRDLIGHCNQLNTIHLNPNPIKNLGRGSGKLHKDFSLKDKTILVVDDITTEGYSFEAARVYLRMAGAKRVILLSWLKTIKSSYQRIRRLSSSNSFNPFEPNTFSEISEIKTYEYQDYVNKAMAAEISSKFKTYCDWDWP